MDMLFYELNGSISGSLQQPGAGSSSGNSQYASPLSAHDQLLPRFHASQVGRSARPMLVHRLSDGGLQCPFVPEPVSASEFIDLGAMNSLNLFPREEDWIVFQNASELFR
jgi:hypothetical protein